VKISLNKAHKKPLRKGRNGKEGKERKEREGREGREGTGRNIKLILN
tara:strand:- start:355 stop:495 length:141 start_codon:yes stop_codon:yes gene_type:complete